jgi:hypothetical protein
LRDAGVTVVRLAELIGGRDAWKGVRPSNRFLEGGEVIPLIGEGRRALLVGFGPRTARESLDLLGDRLMPGHWTRSSAERTQRERFTRSASR